MTALLRRIVASRRLCFPGRWRLIVLILPVAASTGVFRNVRAEEARQQRENEKWSRLDSGVRIYINTPKQWRSVPRTLIIFATPNGNSIEQTLGCSLAPGRDWHFDIQHVAAQMRRLRAIDAQRDLVFAVVQAPRLSWPAFRQAEKNAGEIIRGIVETTAKDTGATQTVLSCHSGGGSFLFGYINSVDAIPDSISRFVFLDANYSYSNEQRHGDKLLAWLNGNLLNSLVVIAYDDRNIVLDGKLVVGPDGGTYRASLRMLERIRQDVALKEETTGPFQHFRGLDGRIAFFIHPNPDNRILHTALVGEMNGLLHALTLKTPLEGTWGTFGGPRAYAEFVQSRPSAEPIVARLAVAPVEFALKFPVRPADAPTGSQFLKQIEQLASAEREEAIRRELTGGNVPNFLRTLKTISVAGTDLNGMKHDAVCFVTPDYLAVGTDDDFFRLPMTPMTAEAIARACGGLLITTKISDAVFKHAELKLSPQPLTRDRESPGTFFQSHQLIESQRSEKHAPDRGLLMAGIKKDVVLSSRLKDKPHRVAIYGWHYPDGKPIQPLYLGHANTYVDYSHGIRLMSRQMIVDGRTRLVPEILRDTILCRLISDEGPLVLE